MSHELTDYLSVFDLFLILEMAILPKRRKPGNPESHNSLKLRFTNIRGIRSNFVEGESFLELNSPDILTLCETNLDDSIDSDNFSVRGYLSLIRKDFVTHMHGNFSLSSKQDGPFHRIAYDYSRTNWDDLRDHLKDVPWEDIFKFSASAAASKFCKWFHVGNDVYIPVTIRPSLTHLHGLQLLLLLP